MFATLLSLNKPLASATEVAAMGIDNISNELLDVCYEEVTNIYKSLHLGAYWASKSKDIVKKLNERLQKLTYTDPG